MVGTAVGGGACVGGGGAFWVRSATTVWAAWVWINAVSWVGAAVAAGPHALKTRTLMITRLRISALLFLNVFFFMWFMVLSLLNFASNGRVLVLFRIEHGDLLIAWLLTFDTEIAHGGIQLFF